MIDHPVKLKKLYYADNGSISVLGYPENNFFVKISDIFSEYLNICEKMNNIEITDFLNSKFPKRVVESFFKNIENYKEQLFVSKSIRSNDSKNYNQTVRKLTLNISHKCNMKCSYCHNKFNYMRDDLLMDEELAGKAVGLFLDQLGNESGQIIFTGGEPLINFELIRYVVNLVEEKGNKPVSYVVKTNATLITKDIALYFADKDFKLNVSLDGNADVHNQNRVFHDGRGSFDKVKNAMDLMYDLGLKDKITVNAVVTHNTAAKAVQTYSFLKNFCGVDAFKFKPVICQGEDEHYLEDDDYPLVMNAMMKQAEDIYFQSVERINTESMDQYDNRCGIGLWNLSIDVNGDIYPCYRLCGMSEYIIGSIHKTGLKVNSICDISMLHDLNSVEDCSICYAKVLCSMGCFVRKLLASENKKCSNFEKIFGDYVLKKSLIETGAHKMLPKV